MNDLSIWELIRSAAAGGESSMLLLTVEKTGSGPGSTGDCMAITPAGRRGSVGGGAMELKLTDLAREMLMEAATKPRFMLYSHTSEAENAHAAASGAICSGKQRILIFPVQPLEVNLLDQILKTLEEGGTVSLHLSSRGMALFKEPVTEKLVFDFRNDDEWSCRLILGERDTVYIIGGGHVGLALARELEPLPFNTVVLDPRSGIEQLLPPGCRWEKVDWCGAHERIPSGEHSWVIVMTPEHTADRDVLASMETVGPGYTGLMASEAKKISIYTDLRGSGTAEDFLSSVRCPVGLPIGSRSPAEIAVSIAAQLIQEKRCRKKTP